MCCWTLRSRHHNLRNWQPPTQPSRFLTETAYLQRIISLVSEGGERPSSGPALLTPAQMVNHMTSRRRVHGFHACVHVCVQEVSEWPGTMDNKTFNSLFHRLPCQRSGAANNQNYSVSECVQMCKCAHVRVRRRVAVELRGLLSPLQLINRVITFCLQQMWDTRQKIHFGVISL